MKSPFSFRKKPSFLAAVCVLRKSAAWHTVQALLLLPLSVSMLSTRAGAQTTPPATFSSNVSNGTTTLTVNFSLHSNRASTFQVYTQGATGTLTSVGTLPARTYLGTVTGRPGAIAAGWLKPDGTVYSKIIFEDGTAWNSTGGTATTAGSTTWTPNFPTTVAPSGGAGSAVYAAEVGIDSCYRNYVACGSNVDNTIGMIEWAVMKANAQYLRDAAILHRIGRVVIRSTQAVDPYDSMSGDSGALLNEVKNQWNTVLPASAHDIATVVDTSINGAGLAWVGVVNTASRYSSVGSTATGDFEVTWRHEAGHNWSSSHYEGGTPEGPTIMSGNSLSRFSGSELAKIINHRNAKVSALNNLGAYSFALPPRANADRAYMYFGESTETIDVLANDSDSNGQALTLLSFDASSARGGTIVRSTGTGPGGRDQLIYTPSANPQPFDHFNYRVQDSAGYQAIAKVFVQAPVPAIYQHSSYGGWQANLPLGTYTTAQFAAAGGVDNDASSIRVPLGYKVTLYADDAQAGTSFVATGNVSFLSAFNDQVSSVKVETFNAELYPNTNYGGTRVLLPLGTYTTVQLAAVGLADNALSSLKVPTGMKVTLYVNDSFGGTSVVKTADDSTLVDDSINDVVSSVKVELAP